MERPWRVPGPAPVADPDDSPPWGGPIATIVRLMRTPRSRRGVRRGWGSCRWSAARTEVVSHPDPGPGRLTYWARRVDGGPMTRRSSPIADLVPLSVSTAMGVVEVGTSLDNTVRVDPSVQTDWVLLDLRPHASIGGCCHGGARLGTRRSTAGDRRPNRALLRRSIRRWSRRSGPARRTDRRVSGVGIATKVSVEDPISARLAGWSLS